MEDLIAPQTDYFSEQAKLHHQIRDALRETANKFEVHHDTILSQLDSSLAGHYWEWWNNFKTKLSNQADIHDQLGKNLITAGDNYQTADQNVAKSMQGIQIPPVK